MTEVKLSQIFQYLKEVEQSLERVYNLSIELAGSTTLSFEELLTAFVLVSKQLELIDEELVFESQYESYSESSYFGD